MGELFFFFCFGLDFELDSRSIGFKYFLPEETKKRKLLSIRLVSFRNRKVDNRLQNVLDTHYIITVLLFKSA